MEKFAIASLAFKMQGGSKDADHDVRIDHISALSMNDKNSITVKMVNGYSFLVPAAVGIELSKLWVSASKGELNPGVYTIDIGAQKPEKTE